MARMQSAPVGLNVAVNAVGVAGCVQQIGDLAGHAELDQVGVGADEGLLIAAGGELGKNVLDGALAVVGDGVEDDTVCHVVTLLFCENVYNASVRKGILLGRFIIHLCQF